LTSQPTTVGLAMLWRDLQSPDMALEIAAHHSKVNLR
jgi:hypothetical protein